MSEIELKKSQLNRHTKLSYIFFTLLFIGINMRLFIVNSGGEYVFTLENKHLNVAFCVSYLLSFLFGGVFATEVKDKRLHWIFWPTALYFISMIFITENLLIIWGLFALNVIAGTNSCIIQKKYWNIVEHKEEP